MTICLLIFFNMLLIQWIYYYYYYYFIFLQFFVEYKELEKKKQKQAEGQEKEINYDEVITDVKSSEYHDIDVLKLPNDFESKVGKA